MSPLRSVPLLRLAAAVGAAVVGVSVLGAAPALAAPKPKVPLQVTSTPPSNPTSLRSATFAWTSTAAGVAYTCTIDGVSSSCASPTSYSGLADGLHTFGLKAKKSGYRPSGYSYSWRVAATPP